MIIRVAIPSPLYALFDYKIDEVSVKIGERVRVPFGKQTVVGIVLEIVDTSEFDNLRKATKLDTTAIFSDDLVKLGQWIASYYHAPIGLVFRMMLPQKLRKLTAYDEKMNELIHLSQDYLLWTTENHAKRAKTTIIEKLINLVPIARDQIVAFIPNYKAHEKSLMDDQVIYLEKQAPLPFDIIKYTFPALPYELNDEQRVAIAAIDLNQFSVTLLEGITGSGKTAVYLELVKKTIQMGKQVLILVPEIGLTPQFIERVEKIIQIPFAVIHSDISEAQKMNAWESAHLHTIPLVIGTRSALFTSFKNLGLIILDEEHDGSYRQSDTVRYSAHDSAIVRAQLLGIPLLLGSATPILETIHNVEQKRYQHLQLKNRAKGDLPNWQIIDMNESEVIEGISLPLLDAIEEALKRQEQIIIYINRRGYSPVLLCESCGWVPECHACQYRLTVYRNSHRLRCHHCGYIEPLPHQCPSCEESLLKMVGQGTERIETVLQNAFPQANIVRFDRDQLHTKTVFQEAVKNVNEGNIDIIIGTQMIAKGHDFAKVTLVGMIDIDGILYSADFRAEEKLAQTLMQVSGRAGRDGINGQVMIQTHFPEHTIFTELPQKGYAQFARELLAQRMSFHFPPFSHQALFQVEGQNEGETLEGFEKLMKSADCHDYPVNITPIYPNALSKRQNYYRFYIVLQSESRKALHNLINFLMAETKKYLPSKIRYFCEIDPWDFD